MMKTVRAMIAGALIAIVAGGAGLFFSRSGESPLIPPGGEELLTIEFEGNQFQWKVYVNPDTGVWELRRARR
jgi:hypothetical protein